MRYLLPGLFFVLLSTNLLAQRDLVAKAEALPCLDRTFSIVAHLVRDSSGQIGIEEAEVLRSIDSLNRWFEPICVRFAVCEFRIVDNFQYSEPASFNEWEQMWVKYNQPNRINLYVVNTVIALTLEPGFADIGAAVLDNQGGVLITKDALRLPKPDLWLAHLFGHYCGLYDTHHAGQGLEWVNGENCDTAGDGICDTPADPYFLSEPLQDYFTSSSAAPCRFIYLGLDPNDAYYTPHVANMMSHYPTECWCGFSYQQYVRMAEVLDACGLW